MRTDFFRWCLLELRRFVRYSSLSEPKCNSHAREPRLGGGGSGDSNFPPPVLFNPGSPPLLTPASVRHFDWKILRNAAQFLSLFLPLSTTLGISRPVFSRLQYTSRSLSSRVPVPLSPSTWLPVLAPSFSLWLGNCSDKNILRKAMFSCHECQETCFKGRYCFSEII